MNAKPPPQVSLSVLGHSVNLTRDFANGCWIGEVADVSHIVLVGDTCTDVVLGARAGLDALHRCGTAGTA